MAERIRKWRIVELRPGVFSVETRRTGGFLIWRDVWTPYGGYIVPGVPEYSPWRAAEFTREAAKKFVRDKQMEESAKMVPPGFPRVVSD